MVMLALVVSILFAIAFDFSELISISYPLILVTNLSITSLEFAAATTSLFRLVSIYKLNVADWYATDGMSFMLFFQKTGER